MENLENRCRGTHLQGRNADAEVENRLLDVEGRRGGCGGSRELGADAGSPPRVNRQPAGACCAARELSAMLCDDLGGREGQSGGYMDTYGCSSSSRSRN